MYHTDIFYKGRRHCWSSIFLPCRWLQNKCIIYHRIVNYGKQRRIAREIAETQVDFHSSAYLVICFSYRTTAVHGMHLSTESFILHIREVVMTSTREERTLFGCRGYKIDKSYCVSHLSLYIHILQERSLHG